MMHLDTRGNPTATTGAWSATARRRLATGCLVPLLVVGVASCAADGTENDAEKPTAAGATSSQSPSDDTEGQDAEAETHAPTQEEDPGTPLEQGLQGTAPVECSFANETVSGTIYLDGPERMRFEGEAPDGSATHILLYDGRAHAWAEGQREGARYPADGESYLVAESAEDVRAHSTDCVPYTGPTSIFELPSNVAFKDVATQ